MTNNGNNKKTDALIVQIYDVITDPEGWPRVLDRFAEYMGAESACLFYSDAVLNELESVWPSSRISEFVRQKANYELFASGIKIYRQIPKVVTERGWVTQNTAVTQYRQKSDAESHDFSLLTSSLESYMGQSMDYAMSPLNFRPNYFDLLTLQYARKPEIKLEERLAECNHLLLHFARALDLSRPFLLLERRFRTVFDVLDKLELGVVIFGENLDVLLKNKSADRILERSDSLRLAEDRSLQPVHEAARKNLAQGIYETRVRRGEQSRSRRLLLPRLNDAEPYFADLSRVEDFYPHPFGSGGALVMMLVDPDETSTLDFSHVQAMYGLTPKEAEVGELLARGYSAAEVAEQLNVSPNTVGTHKRSLYSKAGVHTRVELVRLAHNINIPIFGSPSED
ncbi:MAG: helix-turn-helix transcriptional regulator [Halioglobus sp.]|nr:helix-turn-helix transcriptional regulator [Halioglobus sp.]